MKIVFTNGCFDLFHVGHLRMLQWASQFGRLVVGVNSDDSVRKLKGPDRPIVGEQDRVEIVGALRCVDRAILFDGETPVFLVSNLLPDVLIVGSDHELDSKECWVVRQNGGEIRHSPHFDSLRTTDIIRECWPKTTAFDNRHRGAERIIR